MLRRQTVRRRQWWQNLGLDTMPAVLPKVPRKFIQSSHWDDQLCVMRADYKRMSGLRHIDVVQLTSRFSANVGAYGYIQGYLYLIRTLSWVLGSRQDVLYWAFVRVAHLSRPYGPLGTEMKSRLQNIDFAIGFADKEFDKEILASMVSVRWGFILFAQTFAEREQLLCVWDFVLKNEFNIACIIAALLLVIRFPEEQDTMMRLSKTMDVIIDKPETTPKFGFTTAQHVKKQCYYRHGTSEKYLILLFHHCFFFFGIGFSV